MKVFVTTTIATEDQNITTMPSEAQDCIII